MMTLNSNRLSWSDRLSGFRSFFFIAALLVSLSITAPGVCAALPNKTLIYCAEGSPAGFDPGRNPTAIDYTANTVTIYDRLVEFERGGTKIQPSLAKRWRISKDGRVYTFYLRRGVKFHATPWFTPSREFNAEDVLFTFERMRNPNLPFSRAYPVMFPDWSYSNFDKLITKIEEPSLYTVRFTLRSANAPFLSHLATPFASIRSAEYAAQLLKAGQASNINWQPVGTGPFIFRKYIKDTAIYFDGNPNYWKAGAVRLSHLIFSITPDAKMRAQKLKANECQVISYPRPTDIAMLKAIPTLRVLSQSEFSIGYLAYNVTHQPLNDVRVRRALDMAIDKKAIIDAVYEGRAQIAVAPMSPLQWSYDRTLKDAPRDFKRAKALLAQAGYPKGFAISLWAMPVQRSYNPNARLMAEMIQADWARIGVKAKIVSYEWGEYLKRAQSGEHDAILIGYVAMPPDPSGWLAADLSCDAMRGGSFTRWCYPPFERLIRRAAQITDITQRARLYLQAQKIFKLEQPFTPIAYPTVYQAINQSVTGFKVNPLGLSIFAGVGLQ